MPPGLIVICGPTATGKSHLAMAIAQQLGSPILSADSRQVYRGFNIGTAKPTPAEQAKVPHKLIDLREPTQTLTLAEYQQQAQTLICQYHAQGVTPLLVGGTGLYIKSIVQGLQIPRVGPQAELRQQLQAIGQTQLYPWLQQVDTISAQKIHPNDQVRTMRALEVFYVTGIPLSQQQGQSPPSYPILQIGLDFLNTHLSNQTILNRTEQMLEQGWLSEVKTLRAQYGPKLPLLATLGYQELCQYLEGVFSLLEAKQLITRHTSQLAKRQRTWFRANAKMIWLDAAATDLPRQVTKEVNRWVNDT